MSNISVSISHAVSKGGASIATGTLAGSFAMTGDFMGGGVMQSIGTTNEVMDIPADVTGDIDITITNLDSTNFVGIYRDSGGTPTQLISKLKAGRSCHLANVSASALYAKADTADVKIQFWANQA
jgi:hypothetical protein